MNKTLNLKIHLTLLSPVGEICLGLRELQHQTRHDN